MGLLRTETKKSRLLRLQKREKNIKGLTTFQKDLFFLENVSKLFRILEYIFRRIPGPS